MKVKNNLEKMCKAKAVSLDELAVLSGLTKGCINGLVSGKSYPILSTAFRITAVLDCTVYEVWPDEIEVTEVTIVKRCVKSAA